MSAWDECLLSDFLQPKEHIEPNLDDPYHAELHSLVEKEMLGLSPCHDIGVWANVLLKKIFTILNKNRDEHPEFELEMYEPEICELSKSLHKSFFLHDTLKMAIVWNLTLGERKAQTDAISILKFILTQWDETCTNVSKKYKESVECGMDYKA